MDDIEHQLLQFRNKALGSIRNNRKEDCYRLILGALQTSIDALGIVRRREYPPFQRMSLADLDSMRRRVDALRLIIATLD